MQTASTYGKQIARNLYGPHLKPMSINFSINRPVTCQRSVGTHVSTCQYICQTKAGHDFTLKSFCQSMLRLSFLSLFCVANVGWSMSQSSYTFNLSIMLHSRWRVQMQPTTRLMLCQMGFHGEKLFKMATFGHCLEHANVCHYTMPVISVISLYSVSL